MLSVLTLTFDSYIQSFGENSIIAGHRDSGDLPTKSMVIGMILNALGHDKYSDDPDSKCLPEVWSNKLRFATKKLYKRDAYKKTDFCIARRNDKNKGNDVIKKDYIINGKYHVYLEGDNADIVYIAKALLNPKRQLYLGRKCCVLQDSLCWDKREIKPTITENVRIEDVIFKDVNLTKPFPTHLIEGGDLALYKKKTLSEDGKHCLDIVLGCNMWKPTFFIKKKTTPLQFDKQLWGDMLCYSITYMKYNDLEEIEDE